MTQPAGLTYPVRVALVADSLRRGGAERQFVFLAEGLRKQGYRVNIAVLYDDGEWGAYLRKQGFAVKKLGFRAPPNMNRKAMVPFLRFVVWLRRVKPHIAISFLYRPSIWTALAGGIAGVRCIVSRRADCGFARELAPFSSIWERIANQWTTRYIANCQAVAKSLAKEDIPQSKVDVVYNGTSLPEKTVTGNKVHPVVGILGNLSRIKDHITLVRAMRLVLDKHPGVICEMAGIDSGCGVHVQEEAKRLGIAEKIRHLGPVLDPNAFLSGISIGVNCSLSEGLSNSILEYMAHGIPVVASNVGGNPELVADGHTGYLFEVGDYVALAEKLLALLNSHAKLAEMGEAGRKRVEQCFGLSQALGNWDSILTSLRFNEKER